MKMGFQTFLNHIEKGLPLPVYLFYSSDQFFCREAIEAIKRLVPAEERDFNLHIFDLSSLKEENHLFEQILDVANTASFFRSRRFTVLTGDLGKISKRDVKKLNDYISNPASDSVFVMLHEGMLKGVKEHFGSLKPISLDIRESEIPYWIRQRATMKGVEISLEACEYLIGLVGTDMGLLSAEVEKISLLGKKRLNVDDITDIIAGGRLYNTFDLVNALKEKDAEKIFKIYKTWKETSEDYNLIGALNWQYGHHMVSSTRSNKEYFFRIFEILNHADIDIKSSGRTFPMEYLLVKLLRL